VSGFRTLSRMTIRRTPHRTVHLVLAGMLGLSLLAGCGEGADTDCGLDACTVTFDRGVDASASILGIEAKLIGTQNDQVTLEIAGEQVTLTMGQAATEVAGLQVSLDSVTDSNVSVRIAR
jgi:hypothetical protein